MPSVPPPLPRRPTPAAEFLAGPAGTFIGVPDVNAALPPSEEDDVDATQRIAPGMLPAPPSEPVLDLPPPAPADGVFDLAEALRPPRAPQASKHESSYPGSTVKLRDEVGPSRKPRVGMWIAAVVAVAAAATVGGALFLRRSSAHESTGSPRAVPPQTSPTITDVAVPTPSAARDAGGILIGDGPEPGGAPSASASSRPPMNPSPATRPLRSNRMVSPAAKRPDGTQGHNPASATTLDPANPPPLPPDPFGTPE